MLNLALHEKQKVANIEVDHYNQDLWLNNLGYLKKIYNDCLILSCKIIAMNELMHEAATYKCM